jgi:MSHA pilin protein MshC
MLESPMTFVSPRPSGFTLIELVVTLMIISILGVAAISRFSGTADFDNRGFHDETLAALRYAQKAAVAQRRNVCVTFTSTSVTLKIAADAGSLAPCNVLNLAGPTGATPFMVSGRSRAAFSSVPIDFQFDALGRPFRTSNLTALAQTFQVAGLAQSIRVEEETGYVSPV